MRWNIRKTGCRESFVCHQSALSFIGDTIYCVAKMRFYFIQKETCPTYQPRPMNGQLNTRINNPLAYAILWGFLVPKRQTMSKYIPEKWVFYVSVGINIYQQYIRVVFLTTMILIFWGYLFSKIKKFTKFSKNLFSHQVFYLLKEDLNRTPFEIKTSACEDIYL